MRMIAFIPLCNGLRGPRIKPSRTSDFLSVMIMQHPARTELWAILRLSLIHISEPTRPY